MTTHSPSARRGFLQSATTLAAAPLVGGLGTTAVAQTASAGPTTMGRRKLGKLEVSSLGLGVQNMSRTYQTTVPSRPQMIDTIRRAYDSGVTFFDAAEAYGPHEVERILGEGVAPFRNQVTITSKFGWNIDLQTGERRPGLISRPSTSSSLWKARCSACAPTASTCSTSTAWTHRCPSKMLRARSKT